MEKKYILSIRNLTKTCYVTIGKKLSFLLFIVITMFLSQGIYGQCSDIVNPRDGAQTFNGVTVRRAYKSGLVVEDNTPSGDSPCGQPNDDTQGWLRFGHTAESTINANTPYYSYTFWFSRPVNDIVFSITGLNREESHTISTNAGTVTLIPECNRNNSTIIYANGTSIRTNIGYGSQANGYWGAAANIRVSSTKPYTQLTFSGYGGYIYSIGPINMYQGSTVNLCSGSIVPAVPPTISGITPATQTRCINSSAQAIKVNATGATSYQWYMNTTNSTTGATAIPGATSVSYTPPINSTVGTLYYYVVATNANGNTTSPIAKVTTENCACYKPGIPATTGKPALITKIGISSLTRTPAQNADNWPAARKGGWLALEARTKGFVPNRLAFNSSGNPVGIAPANFVEGMMVYDTTNKCLKMYTSKDGGTTLGWYCMTTQACPD